MQKAYNVARSSGFMVQMVKPSSSFMPERNVFKHISENKDFFAAITLSPVSCMFTRKHFNDVAVECLHTINVLP